MPYSQKDFGRTVRWKCFENRLNGCEVRKVDDDNGDENNDDDNYYYYYYDNDDNGKGVSVHDLKLYSFSHS